MLPSLQSVALNVALGDAASALGVDTRCAARPDPLGFWHPALLPASPWRRRRRTPTALP